jgi:CubicO group peptidase (beta-lactamase class C family)
MSSRRSFVASAASAAVVGLCGLPVTRGVRAESGPIVPQVEPLIAAERSRILAAMAKEDIPGVGVCLIRDGEPVWVEGLGVTDRQSNRPVSVDTIFSIQSTSKNITAVATLLAVQHGLLDLDAPIGEYLPDFSVQSRFDAAPQAKITLRLLLSHRAGFTHEAPVGNNYAPESPDFASHVRSISATWLRYPVGERYRYSNLGFDLAGYIVQVRTRMLFADWVRTVVFEPLGMVDSTVSTEVYVHRKNRAVGHLKGYTSVPLKTPLIASGGVYTSARDMAAYARFQLNRGTVGDRVILRADLWEEMHAFALGGDYSLGVIRQELRYGDTPVRLLGHQGGGFGFGCVFDYCPEAGLAWVALFNRPADDAYRFGSSLVASLLTQRFGAQKPRLPVRDLAPIELSDERLESFVGNWIGRAFMRELRVSNGALGMQVGSTFTLLKFLDPAVVFTAAADGNAVLFDYDAERTAEPAHLECFVGELSLDYNDGPNDVAGPDKSSWATFEGNYHIDQWGKPSEQVTVHRKDGWLYLNQIRLIGEFEPGLFFTSDGEAVDFRPGGCPDFRVIGPYFPREGCHGDQDQERARGRVAEGR